MAINGGKNEQAYPKLTPVRSAAAQEIKALQSKLIHDPTAPRRSSAEARHLPVSRWSLDRIANKTAQNIIDSDSISQLLPDIELVEQILVGSILSPKDMSTTEINFKLAEGQFDGEIGRPMLDVIEGHFKHDYKIDDRLDLDLQEALMTKGAHIKAVLPENNLDMIINGNRKLSMEQFNVALSRAQDDKQLGFLGHPTQANIGLENFNGRTLEQMLQVKGKFTISLEDGKSQTVEHTLKGLHVTDNFNVLKGTKFKRQKRERHVADKLKRLRVSVEQATQDLGLDPGVDPVQHDVNKGLTSEQIDQLYRRSQPRSQQTQVLVSQAFMERAPVGHPLAIDLPMESVVPVYTPGKPDDHVGYFVLLDQFGRPICKSDGRDYYGEMRTSFNGNQKDNSSELLRMTRDAMGNGKQESTFELDQIYQTYEGILENDLQNRLRNGMYDEDMTIGLSQEIKRIMLYRSFKAQNTQLLYIPAELVTYIAFNYNQDGVGETLLSRSKILANMRSILLFAETMSGVRNAIGRKKVQITTDVDDPDPQQTISDVQSLILEQAHRGFPLGAPDPAQSLDYLNRAGYDFSIDSQQDGYANTKVEFDDYTTNQQAGSPDLQDKLRRMHASGMGVNPDLVDPTSSPDFAVSVVNNNLIMTRRVKFYQKIFTGHYTKFVRCYTRHSSTLLADLLEVYEDHKDMLTPEQQKLTPEELVEEFINAVILHLPEPDNTQLEIQSESFSKYNEILESALAAYITEDMFPEELMGERASLVQKAIAEIKGYFQRQFLARNNILPELDILTRMDGDKPAFSLLDSTLAMGESLGTALLQYFNAMEERKAKMEAANPAPVIEGADGQDGMGAGDGGLETDTAALGTGVDGDEPGDGLGDLGGGGGADDLGFDAPGLDAPGGAPADAGTTGAEADDLGGFDAPSLDGGAETAPESLDTAAAPEAADAAEPAAEPAEDAPVTGEPEAEALMETESLDAPEEQTSEPEPVAEEPEEPESEEEPEVEEPDLDAPQGMEAESIQARKEQEAKEREDAAKALEEEEAAKGADGNLETPDLDDKKEEDQPDEEKEDDLDTPDLDKK
jgi:TPR repeat protein